MRRLIWALSILLLLSGTAFATNGDNLIGVGPISRAMGGVGIAAPQDPISAVFANPAAMCFGPYCPGSQFDFAGTIFSPTVKARVRSATYGVNSSAESQSAPYIIPAIGVSTPINLKTRFGLAAYGVSGLGVDYRDQLDLFPAAAGYEGEIYTQYQVMKFAPNIAYMLKDNLSVGAAVHIDYAALDLGSGTSHDYTTGLQLGTIFKADPISVGLSYVTPQSITHERVSDFDGNGTADNLELEMPQTLGAGVAYLPIKDLLVEVNAKWINWADAAGYKDFDWDNQMVYALGVQYKATPGLSLRAGYNFSDSPVKEHNGFNGNGVTVVQGKNVPTFNYEYLRIIGFPAVAEQHVSFGVGFKITDKLTANLGYKRALENTVSETGNMDFGGGAAPITLESDLSEDSYEFGLSWMF